MSALVVSVALVVAVVSSLARLVRDAPVVRDRPCTRRRLGLVDTDTATLVNIESWRFSAVACGWRRRWSAGPWVARLRGPGVDRAYEQRLPVALEAVARALLAGTPLATALSDASTTTEGSVADDLTRVADELGQGVPSSEALDGWLIRRPLPGVRLTVAALVMGTELGGSRARAVDRVAVGLRQRAASAREVHVMASQARLSAVVIVAAPVVFALVSVATSSGLATFLFVTPRGWACLVGGLSLDAVGAWWMARLVRSASG